jgi:hypothetical protein
VANEPLVSDGTARRAFRLQCLASSMSGAPSSRDAFSDFWLEKGERLFRHRKSNGAGRPPDASPGYRRIDLHGASGCVRRRSWHFHAALGCTHGFIRARNCAYWASLLDSERCGLRRQPGGLLQRPQHHGRLLAVMHYRRRKLLDRWIARYRRAITCGLLGPRCSVMSRMSGTGNVIDDLIDSYPKEA